MNSRVFETSSSYYSLSKFSLGCTIDCLSVQKKEIIFKHEFSPPEIAFKMEPTAIDHYLMSIVLDGVVETTNFYDK